MGNYVNKTCLLVLTIILIPCISYAKTETIFANHVYLMGDNDSKNDARRICFIEAKRKVLEKAGTYIESKTQVKNFELTKDEISTYSAALLKVETVKEEWKFVGKNMAVDISVKAKVDTSKIENQLSKIHQDKSVQYKIKEQQRQIKELERKFLNLQKKVSSADSSEAIVLRKEKNVVFKEIESIQAKKIRISQEVKARTSNVLALVERGMTKNEVISLVGNPPSGSINSDYWRYGNVIVVFEEGAVGCIVNAHVTTLQLDCEYIGKTRHGAIIK
jgi:hypothetical protein